MPVAWPFLWLMADKNGDMILYDSAGDTDGALPNPSNFSCASNRRNRAKSDH